MLKFLLLVLTANLCAGHRINITSLGNCLDIPMHYDVAQVELKNIVYTPDSEGFIDSLSGTYVVRTDTDPYEANELIITTFQCPPEVKEVCQDNMMEFVEPMSCAKFHEGTGPWSMFSTAMHDDSRCGETPVRFVS